MNCGCFYHMCPIEEYFETLKLKECGVVHLRNDRACKVQGLSFVCLMMFDNREFILRDVNGVPKHKQNLLLISMFNR
jgi:hypothetical protein